MHSNNLFVTTLKNHFLQCTTATTDYRALIWLFYDDSFLIEWLGCYNCVLFCSSSLLHQQQLWEPIRFACGCLFSAFFPYMVWCVLTELTATFNFLMYTLFVINYMNETVTLVWRNMNNRWYLLWTCVSDISSHFNNLFWNIVPFCN